MQSEQTVSPEICAEIRRQYSTKDGLKSLVDQFDIAEEELRNHLYGDCNHDIDVSPFTAPGRKHVTEQECGTFRKKATNTPTAEIADSHGYTRKTIARHAFGRCTHQIETSPADPFECKSKEEFTPSECADLRVKYRSSEFETVLDFSAGRDNSYQAILTHIRGRCDHEIDEQPVEGADRVTDVITQETCKRIRKYWRSNLSATISGVAEEFNVSAETAERHIKFLCPHQYETVKADEMDIFSEALGQ